MRTVAIGLITCLFAPTQSDGFIGSRFEQHGQHIRTTMRAVAQWLAFATPARAPGIFLPFDHFDLTRPRLLHNELQISRSESTTSRSNHKKQMCYNAARTAPQGVRVAQPHCEHGHHGFDSEWCFPHVVLQPEEAPLASSFLVVFRLFVCGRNRFCLVHAVNGTRTVLLR